MRVIHRRIVTSFPVLSLISVMLAGNPAPRVVNLYLLDFDNLRSDPSVAWLSNGFVDMIKEGFSEFDGVRIFGRTELEQILQDRSVFLRQPRGTGNVLVMGSFVRDLDRITVNVQLLNISNWKELSKITTMGSVNLISKLGSDLFTDVSAALRDQIPAQTGGVLRPPLARAEPPEYHEQVSQMSSSLSDALSELEESMDLYIGARAKGGDTGASEGRYYRDFSFDGSGNAVDFPSEDAELLETILSRISKNPYSVDIGKPSLKMDRSRKDDRVRLSIPVKYSLRENLIKDMLSSLPYTGIRQDGSITSLEFSRRKFKIPGNLEKRISRGAFRIVPVIQLLDKSGNIRLVILDSADPYWHRQTSKNVKFTTEHVFSPLVAFSVSGWSLQVTMESAEISATYELDVPEKEAGSYSRVQVEFVPEIELTTFLSNIL
ncbi:MAG: hypothetical protein V3U24_05875 [Candidatus Neomarinimicrobiota bacterium]